MVERSKLSTKIVDEVRGSNLGEGEDFYYYLSPLFNFHAFISDEKRLARTTRQEEVGARRMMLDSTCLIVAV